MGVRNYVETKFNETEKFMFDFIVNSFPETVLNNSINQQGTIVESEEMLVMVALLAKALGESRDIVMSLDRTHDIDHLIDLIKTSEDIPRRSKLALYLLLSSYTIVDFQKDYISVDRALDDLEYMVDTYILLKNKTNRNSMVNGIKLYAKKSGVNIDEVLVDSHINDDNIIYYDVSSLISQESQDIDLTYNDGNGIPSSESTVFERYFPVKYSSNLVNFLKELRRSGLLYRYVVKVEEFMLKTQTKGRGTNGKFDEEPMGFVPILGTNWEITWPINSPEGAQYFTVNVSNNSGVYDMFVRLEIEYNNHVMQLPIPSEVIVAGDNKNLVFEHEFSNVGFTAKVTAYPLSEYRNGVFDIYSESPETFYNREVADMINPTVYIYVVDNSIIFAVYNPNDFAVTLKNSYRISNITPVLYGPPILMSTMTIQPATTSGARTIVNNSKVPKRYELTTKIEKVDDSSKSATITNVIVVGGQPRLAQN